MRVMVHIDSPNSTRPPIASKQNLSMPNERGWSSEHMRIAGVRSLREDFDLLFFLQFCGTSQKKNTNTHDPEARQNGAIKTLACTCATRDVRAVRTARKRRGVRTEKGTGSRALSYTQHATDVPKAVRSVLHRRRLIVTRYTHAGGNK